MRHGSLQGQSLELSDKKQLGWNLVKACMGGESQGLKLKSLLLSLHNGDIAVTLALTAVSFPSLCALQNMGTGDVGRVVGSLVRRVMELGLLSSVC